MKKLVPFLLVPLSFAFAGTPKGAPVPSKTAVSYASREIQGFDFRVWLSNCLVEGLQAWDASAGYQIPVPPRIGCEYPANSGIEHLFGAGPRIGAIVNGRRVVSEAYNGNTGSQSFVPDFRHLPLEHFYITSLDSTGQPNRAGYDDDGDGKIDEDPLDGIDNDGDWNAVTDDVGADGLPDSLEASCDGQPFDPVINPDPAQDDYDPAVRDHCHPDAGTGIYPFKNNADIWTERNGRPDHGEPHVDEDFAAYSDRDLFCRTTDRFSFPLLSPRIPMGVEISQRSYAWKAGTAANAMTIIDYTFKDTGTNIWHDAYFGYFADMDVGPVNVPDYFGHNYAAYDSATHTGYVANPLDTGSTPLGVVFLDGGRSLDSLRFVFRWSLSASPLDDPTDDSIMYAWMSGDAFPGQLIKPDGSPDRLTDVRVFMSWGATTLHPGEAAHAAIALVSGKDIPDMLSNAGKAHAIYDHAGFLMPNIHPPEFPASNTLTVRWDPLARSPFAPVVSYRVFHGRAPGGYTDSIDTDADSMAFDVGGGGAFHYFAVAARDARGIFGPLSTEVTSAPAFPPGFHADWGERSIKLTWGSVVHAAAYRLYRRIGGEPDPVLLATLENPGFTDTAVWGDKRYYYTVTTVDSEGRDGPPAPPALGRLVPPSTPGGFVVGDGANFVRLGWNRNTEGDFRRYDVYAVHPRNPTGYDTVKLGGTPATTYLDAAGSTSAYYFVEAVDTTDASSAPTQLLEGHAALRDLGILLAGPNEGAQISASYDSLLGAYKHGQMYGSDFSKPEAIATLSRFSTVIWNQLAAPTFTLPPAYPLGLKAYLLGGGNLLVMGRRLPVDFQAYWYPFLVEFFGIDLFTETDPAPNFAGAYGLGWPTLRTDASKLAGTGGRLGSIERFTNIPADRVIYRFISDPYDPAFEGDPVGLRATDTTYHGLYLSFPLYDLDRSSSSALLARVLSGFGEPTATGERQTEAVPAEYRLHDGYPNPFNPATHLRVDLPRASEMTLTIYDVLGRTVARLIDGRRPAGSYVLTWDAAAFASGLYIAQMRAVDDRGIPFASSRKLVLAK